jgi:hypothetical protein
MEPPIWSTLSATWYEQHNKQVEVPSETWFEQHTCIDRESIHDSTDGHPLLLPLLAVNLAALAVWPKRQSYTSICRVVTSRARRGFLVVRG